MAALLMSAKRVDEREPTMCLSTAVIDTFRNDLLGGGTWGKEAKEAMSNKSYLSRKQYSCFTAGLHVTAEQRHALPPGRRLRAGLRLRLSRFRVLW